MTEERKEGRPDAEGQAEPEDPAIPQDPGIPGPKTVREQPDDLSERPPGRDEPEGAEPT